MSGQEKSKIKIYFTWNELPTYGYHLLKHYYDELKKSNLEFIFKVISTKTSVKYYFDDHSEFNNQIIWVDSDLTYYWDDLKLDYPDILFQAGWYLKPFNFFGKITKKKDPSSLIVLLSDNSLKKNNLKQYLGKFIIKYYIRKRFDLVFVPGRSGYELMSAYGFKSNEIFLGLYSSFIKNFENYRTMEERKKQFVCVTRLIKLKNLLRLINAFKQFNKINGEYKLIIVGSGEVSIGKNLDKFNIIHINHLTPKNLVKLYNESQFFILPSTVDHWPLVVHEAALSGNYLLLSERIGNIPEFANSKNSIIFNPYSSKSILQSLKIASTLPIENPILANTISSNLGKKFNYDFSFNQFMKIIFRWISKN